MVKVAVGVVYQAGKLLLAQRPLGKHYHGYWEFPGGKIEANELPEEALKRELQEELGIQILDFQFCFQHIHHYQDRSVSLEIFLITSFSGEPQGKENQMLQWVTFSQMSSFKLLEGNLGIIERLKSLCVNLDPAVKPRDDGRGEVVK